MEVKKYYFSKNNLNSLCKKLGQKLELENEGQYQACGELLMGQMKLVYEQNKSVLNKGSTERVLKHLNDKAMGSCEKIYHEKIYIIIVFDFNIIILW